ncbi:MAG: S-methyl-5-thioribose-1-phosphate isomerase, partial [Gammaproteobacteria bacterium]|nr:S-methyl-5-thioribose-1-phosphate isomerase [Gammaproteobacteria bacterium]
QSVGVDCTLITDNMAAHMMSIGEVNMVLVGTDRVVANGDVANKIGTLNLAILCRHFGLPFYVACPVSTIDLGTATGSEIEIEQRSPEEVSQMNGKQIAPVNIAVSNPAFDITPASLVTGIITENGIISAPYPENLRKVIQRSSL